MISTKLYCKTHKNLLAIFHGQRKSEVASSKKVEFVNGTANNRKEIICHTKHVVLEKQTKAEEFEE